jgi:hypothetical protein
MGSAAPAGVLVHCLCHCHVTLKAEVSGHLSVAISKFPIADVIAVRPRQERSRAQQPDLVYHKPWFDRYGGQSVDGNLCFAQIFLAAALSQRFYQDISGIAGP